MNRTNDIQLEGGAKAFAAVTMLLIITSLGIFTADVLGAFSS